MSSKEVNIKLPHVSLAAIQYGNDQRPVIIGMHGWLDNALTFAKVKDRLADDFCLISLDLPGHGKSSHKSHDAVYTIWEPVLDVIQALDKLGLERAHFVGHSMGGAIASLLAGAFPERVDRLCLIEAIGPLSTTPESSLEKFRKSATQIIQARGGKAPSSGMPSLEFAAKLRVNKSVHPISLEAAETLVSRSTIERDGRYHWSFDDKCRWGSLLSMSEAHVETFLSGIEADTLFILGEQGLLTNLPYVESRASKIARIHQKTFPGGHHLHLEESASLVSEAVYQFLAD